ncbi:hypothetical protein BC834DRAFT_872255 [Gloeopeniophorella convolvens]|nr:hypothetical protein BC834DRAFT_872255 [Gloeopeniophorella convolvens]
MEPARALALLCHAYRTKAVQRPQEAQGVGILVTENSDGGPNPPREDVPFALLCRWDSRDLHVQSSTSMHLVPALRGCTSTHGIVNFALCRSTAPHIVGNARQGGPTVTQQAAHAAGLGLSPWNTTSYVWWASRPDSSEHGSEEKVEGWCMTLEYGCTKSRGVRGQI